MLAALAVIVTAAPARVEAQLEDVPLQGDRTVALELLKPFFDDGSGFDADGIEFQTSTLRARGLFRLSPTTHLLADWGVSVGAFASGTDYTFANPELGFAVVDTEGRPRVQMTAVLPLAFSGGGDDGSVLTGTRADPFRVDRYSDQVASLNLRLTPRTELSPTTDLITEIGAAGLIPTGEGDVELLSRYGIGVEHEGSRLRLRAQIEGFAIISESGVAIGDRTIHRVNVGVGLPGVGPSAFFRFPLDDAFEPVGGVLGVTFGF